MKKSLIALALARAFGLPLRAKTQDVAFTYRMGAGFPGQINRTHPFSALPGLTSPTKPPRYYGDPVVIDAATNSYRALDAGDAAVTKIDGIAVRPYPTQQMSATSLNAPLGQAQGPGPNQAETFLNEGFIMAKCHNFATQQPSKDGGVYIWIAADAAPHVEGGFESVASGANTILISNAKWNGPCDSDGIGEIQIAAPLA